MEMTVTIFPTTIGKPIPHKVRTLVIVHASNSISTIQSIQFFGLLLLSIDTKLREIDKILRQADRKSTMPMALVLLLLNINQSNSP